MKNLKLTLLALFATSMFTSCTDNVSSTDDIYGDYNVIYSVSDLGDLLDYATVAVEYIDENGETKTAGITEIPWSVDLEDVQVPFTAKFSVYVTLNSTIPDLTDVTLDLGIAQGIYVLNSEGGIIGLKSSGSVTSAGESVAYAVLEALESNSPHTIEYEITND